MADPLVDLAGGFRNSLNYILGLVTGTPQFNLNTVANAGSLSIPNVNSLEDIQTQILDRYGASLPRGQFNETEYNALEDAVRQAGQNFLDNPSAENRVQFNSAVQQLQGGANAIRAQVQLLGSSEDYLGKLRKLFEPGTAYNDALTAAQSRLDNPVLSATDIAKLVGSSVANKALEGKAYARSAASDLASRGIGSSAAAGDILSNARLNLGKQLDDVRLNTKVAAENTNASARSDLIGLIGQLEGLKTSVLGGAEGQVFGLNSSVVPGSNISDPNFLQNLGAQLAQVGLFNEQLANTGFKNTVDSVKNDFLTLTQLFNKPDSGSSGSSGSSGQFGIGVPGLFSFSQGF